MGSCDLGSVNVKPSEVCDVGDKSLFGEGISDCRVVTADVACDEDSVA